MINYDNSLTSNIDNRDKELVIEAAKQSGFEKIVYIKDIAYWYFNRKRNILNDSFGLHTNSRQIDHRPFWKKFELLKKEKQIEQLHKKSQRAA